MRKLNKFKETKQGMIPEDWDILTIEEIAIVVSGATPSTKDSDNFGGFITWITPKVLSNYSYRYIEKGERNITEIKILNKIRELLLPQLISGRLRIIDPEKFLEVRKN